MRFRIGNKGISFFLLIILFSILIVFSCKKESDDNFVFNPTPHVFPKPTDWRAIPLDANNPVSEEGIALGRKLFFDPILSSDFTISCASCHKPELSFSDDTRTSKGVNGQLGKRNSMPLINLAWNKKLFWDVRSNTLPEQALIPVPQHDEMNLDWAIATDRLQKDANYPMMFRKAFNEKTITKELVAKAIAQFEMTLISYNSTYDKYVRGEVNPDPAFFRGLEIFRTEKGDCFHCHALAAVETFADPVRVFTNNGMDLASNANDFLDLGVGKINGLDADKGKFKIPTLRNLAFTAPYMHDGRFATLEDVIESYNLGPKNSPTVDNIMIVKANYRLENYGHYGLALSAQEKADLKYFLLSMSDTSFVNNPDFKKPIE
ncbi:MAG: cytochrome-c peroxidase [Bacteroidetes bacterium]|nr:cytochrome-c peroxidase [Bacteroidota bacterium]